MGNLLMLATCCPASVVHGAEYGYDTAFQGCWIKKRGHLGRAFLLSRSWGLQQTLLCGLTELLRKTKVMEKIS